MDLVFYRLHLESDAVLQQDFLILIEIGIVLGPVHLEVLVARVHCYFGEDRHRPLGIQIKESVRFRLFLVS